jgi:hypothetical protein
LKRLDWRDFPELTVRKAIETPFLQKLTPAAPLWENELPQPSPGRVINDSMPINPNGF